MMQMENFYLRDTIMETRDINITGKDWYIVEVNTPKNLKKLRSMVTASVPKGCSVVVTSQSRHSLKQRKSLQKRVFLTNYIFVLCNFREHMQAILTNLESIGIPAKVLIDPQTNVPVVLDDDDLMWLYHLDGMTREIEFKDDVYEIGDKIRAVGSPMKGFVGNVTGLTPERVFSSIKLKENTYNISFKREDIIKEED